MKNISLYINFFIGIFWISFITWRLILLERLPYVIVQRLSWLQVCIVVSVLLWNVVEVVSIYKLLHRDMSQSILVKRLLVVVNHIYWKPLRVIEAFILHTIPCIREVLGSVGDLVVKYRFKRY